MAETVEKQSDSEEQRQVLLQEAQKNLEYFWQKEGSPDLARMSPYDRRLIFDVPLTLYLDLPEKTPHFTDERNERVADFQKRGWLPKYPAEIRVAVSKEEEGRFQTKGADERMRRARHAGGGQEARDGAKVSTFGQIEEFLKDAQVDATKLQQFIQVDSWGNSIDLEALRGRPDVLNIIADYLNGREMLDRGLDYHSKRSVEFKDRRRYWRGFMQAAVQPGFASPEVIAATFNDIYTKVRNRREDWRAQHDNALAEVGHLLVKDAQEIAIPVISLDDDPEDKEEPPKDDNPRPWENPPVKQLGGLEGIQPIIKPEEPKTIRVRRPEPPLPKPLVRVEEKPKPKATRGSSRPPVTRNNLSAAGKRIADKDKVHEFDRRAEEGTL